MVVFGELIFWEGCFTGFFRILPLLDWRVIVFDWIWGFEKGRILTCWPQGVVNLGVRLKGFYRFWGWFLVYDLLGLVFFGCFFGVLPFFDLRFEKRHLTWVVCASVLLLQRVFLVWSHLDLVFWCKTNLVWFLGALGNMSLQFENGDSSWTCGGSVWGGLRLFSESWHFLDRVCWFFIGFVVWKWWL